MVLIALNLLLFQTILSWMDDQAFVILKKTKDFALLRFLVITITKDLKCVKSSFMEAVVEMKIIFAQLMNAEGYV